jgi:hypothetical protein
MKKKLVVLSGLFLSLPALAFAQGLATCSTNTGDLWGVLCTVGRFLNAIVPVLVALGVVLFVWGVITMVVANDEEAKTKGRNRMIWGIIGFAVIVGMWGLVNLLGKTFGVGSGQNTNTITLPGVQ